MADRYWVGGTGSWTTTSTTNWSATSGGASGASVPTSSDDVFFDAASSGASYTVTVTTVGCRNLTVTAPATGAVTFAGTGALQPAGNISIPAGTLWTHTGQFSVNNIGNTVTVSIVPTLTGVLGFFGTLGVTLLNNITTNGNVFFNHTNTVSLNSFNLSGDNFSWNSGNINLTSGNIILKQGVSVNASSGSVMTTSGGVMQMLDNSAGLGSTFTWAGTTTTLIPLTIPASANLTADITINLTDTAAISTLNFESPLSTGQRRLRIASTTNCKINVLNLGTSGADPSRRIFCFTSLETQNRLITNSTSATLINTDFFGINLSTARSGTSLGNSGATTNITFTAAKTVYWNLVAGGTWGANAFATTSGGAPALANWPLPQDTVIFENTGLNTSASVVLPNSFSAYPGMDASTRTNAMTIRTTYDSSACRLTGTIYKFPAVVTWTDDILVQQSFTNTVTNFFYQNSTTPFGRISQTQGGNLTLGNNSFVSGLTLVAGTFNLNNFTLTASTSLVYSSTVLSKTLAFGSTGAINITALTGTLINGNATNFSTTGTGSKDVNITGASTGTRTLATAVLTEANVYSINVTDGSVASTLTLTGLTYLNFNCTGYSGSITGVILTLYGNLTWSTTVTLSCSVVFEKASGTQTYQPNGRSLNGSIEKRGNGTLTFLGSSIATSFFCSAGTVQLNNFTHTASQSFNFQLGSTATVLDWGSVGSTITMTSSTGNFANNRSSQSSVTWTGAGTKTINFTSTTTSGTRVCYPGTNLNESSAPNVNFTGAAAAGTAAVTLTGAIGTTHFKSLTFPVGGVYTWNNATGSPSAIFYGNLTLTSTVTLSYNGDVTFSNTSGTAVLTSAGKIFTGRLGRNIIGGTTQLADAATTTSSTSFFVTAGTWNFNNFTLTAQIFSAAGTATRSLAFGTGSLNLNTTASATVISIASGGTGFSVSGTPTVNVTGATASGVTRTITIVGTPEAASLNVNVTAGAAGSIVSIDGCTFKSLNFTGAACTLTGTATVVMYGSLTLNINLTISFTSLIKFANTSGFASLVCQTRFLPSIEMAGVGGTLSLNDNMFVTGTFYLTGGTLSMNAVNGSQVGVFDSSVTTNARTLNTGTSGGIFLKGTGTVWNIASTNLTVSGTGTITMSPTTAGAAQTFVGGGVTTYPTLVFATGTSVYTITGNNTFTTFGNAVALRTIRLTAGSTQTMTNFNLAGTAGNLTALDTTSAGSQATLSKASGTVTASYLSIQDSNATGGATWDASNGTNTNAGNNTGWFFGAVASLASAFFNFF